MSGRSREGTDGRSILTAVEAQVPALAQLFRQATDGSTHSWLLDTERLTGLLAGSVSVITLLVAALSSIFLSLPPFSLFITGVARVGLGV